MEAFFANFFATMLTMLVAQSMGLFLGAAVMKPKTAMVPFHPSTITPPSSLGPCLPCPSDGSAHDVEHKPSAQI